MFDILKDDKSALLNIIVTIIVVVIVVYIHLWNKDRTFTKCKYDGGVSIETISRAWVCKSQDNHIIWVK